jgi:phosphoserine phosphatase
LRVFNSVVIDVDSTLCGLEGIDWLARRKSESTRSEVAGLTDRAMNGEITLDSVYGHRMKLVAPARGDIDALGAEYCNSIVPGAVDAIRQMREAGVDVHLLSGGLLPAIRQVARKAEIPDGNVHAVDVQFDDAGGYTSFDDASPLTRDLGKREIVTSLKLTRPILIVGDGSTDAEVRPVVDAYAAFTRFVRRDAAVAKADYVVSSFEEILSLVLK